MGHATQQFKPWLHKSQRHFLKTEATPPQSVSTNAAAHRHRQTQTRAHTRAHTHTLTHSHTHNLEEVSRKRAFMDYSMVVCCFLHASVKCFVIKRFPVWQSALCMELIDLGGERTVCVCVWRQ